MKNKYEIRGDITVIFLQCKDGEVVETIIDTADFSKVNSYGGTWHVKRDKRRANQCGSSYVYIEIKHAHHYLSRVLLGAPKGIVVDHINQNTLNNRRSNLRAVTVAENGQNRKLNVNSTSNFPGVFYRTSRGRWEVSVQFDKRRKYVGHYESFDEAKGASMQARKDAMPFSQESMAM